MNNITFKKDLLGVQDDLLRFAYKLTSDREEANDLALKTFENMEANPNEMTIDWFLEKVLDKATYEESYGIQML